MAVTARPRHDARIATLLVLVVSACDAPTVVDSSVSTAADASATPSTTATTPAPAGDSSSGAPASASAAATASSPTLTAKEFCDAAVELGNANMAPCAVSEREIISALSGVKSIGMAPKECSMRVESANVELHGDVAHRCIEAARKRGGTTTFFAFHLIAECKGVLTGKAGEGRPVLFQEECATGLAKRGNQCVKPGAKNAACGDHPGGMLGNPDDHPRCEEGLLCFMTRWGGGYSDELACLPPAPVGAPCKLEINTCAPGTSCYQGKCRTLAGEGGECMFEDCLAGMWCHKSGGAFGQCVKRDPGPDQCVLAKKP